MATGKHEKHSHSTPAGWFAKQTHGGHHHHDENFRPRWLWVVVWLDATHFGISFAVGRFNFNVKFWLTDEPKLPNQQSWAWNCPGSRFLCGSSFVGVAWPIPSLVMLRLPSKMITPTAYKLKEVRLRWYLEKPTPGIFGSAHSATFSAGFWFKLTDPDPTTMNHLHLTHALETRFHFCKKRGC